jgi:hypothetical protein
MNKARRSGWGLIDGQACDGGSFCHHRTYILPTFFFIIIIDIWILLLPSFFFIIIINFLVLFNHTSYSKYLFKYVILYVMFELYLVIN